MSYILNHPSLVLVISLLSQCLAAYAGDFLRTKRRPAAAGLELTDLGVVVGATLTLLALIVGFCFAMAIDRYDQRKNYEEAEANAIGTEYVRADLLPATARVRELLAKYTEQRILFYRSRDQAELSQIATTTAKLQNDLWTTVAAPALAQPTPVSALAVAGMNDVLNSQGYTQAAWRNRIPGGAWVLMILVAVACNLLLGVSERRGATLLVLPVVISIPLFLIADMDSPRGGIIRVVPQNLTSLQQSFGGR